MQSRLDLDVKNANKMSGVDLDPSNLDAHTLIQLEMLFKNGAMNYNKKDQEVGLIAFGLAFCSKLQDGNGAYIYLSPVGARLAMELFAINWVPPYLDDYFGKAKKENEDE